MSVRACGSVWFHVHKCVFMWACVCECICVRYWAEYSLSCWPSKAAKWQVGSQPFGLIMNQLTFEDQISRGITIRSNRLHSHLWFRSWAVTFIHSYLQWVEWLKISRNFACFRDRGVQCPANGCCNAFLYWFADLTFLNKSVSLQTIITLCVICRV